MINRYYRNVSRRKANEILAPLQNGNFFIRHSSVNNSFVLSMVIENQIEHMLIGKKSNKFHFDHILPTLLTTLREFDSLDDIVKSLVENEKAVPFGSKFVDHKLITDFLNKYWSQEFVGSWGMSSTSPVYIYLKLPKDCGDKCDINKIDIKKLLAPFYFKISDEFSIAFQKALTLKQIKPKHDLCKVSGFIFFDYNRVEILEELMNLANLKQVHSLKDLTIFKVQKLHKCDPNLDISILPAELREQIEPRTQPLGNPEFKL